MRALTELGELDAARLSEAIAVQTLGIEQEGERVDGLVVAGQSLQGVSGTAQTETSELLLQRFMQHERSPYRSNHRRARARAG